MDKENIEDKEVINEFISYFIKNTTSLNSEFSKIVNDNFWNMI